VSEGEPIAGAGFAEVCIKRGVKADGLKGKFPEPVAEEGNRTGIVIFKMGFHRP
jgi:hypothetical protein